MVPQLRTSSIDCCRWEKTASLARHLYQNSHDYTQPIQAEQLLETTSRSFYSVVKLVRCAVYTATQKSGPSFFCPCGKKMLCLGQVPIQIDKNHTDTARLICVSKSKKKLKVAINKQLQEEPTCAMTCPVAGLMVANCFPDSDPTHSLLIKS